MDGGLNGVRHARDAHVEGGSLKLFREDPEKFEHLKPLGDASRIYYTLRDLHDEVARGQINIPQEDCEEFGVDYGDIINVAKGEMSRAVKDWMCMESERGIGLFAEHERHVPTVPFYRLGSMTLTVVYLWLAGRYLMKTLGRNA